MKISPISSTRKPGYKPKSFVRLDREKITIIHGSERREFTDFNAAWDYKNRVDIIC